MLLISAKREQWIRASYPEYFRQVWREEKGQDLLIRAIRTEQFNTLSGLSLVCLLVVSGFVVYLTPKNQPIQSGEVWSVLGLVSVFILTFACFDFCRSSTEGFRASLAEVSACLGRTNEQLAELNQAQLRRIACDQLYHISGRVTLLEEYPSKEPDIVKEAGIHILRTRFQMYRFWELVPDNGKGEDGWKGLLTPRA